MKRHAFTTLELLIVIGIIMLLMAISVLGFRSWDRAATNRETSAQLGICKKMLVEYERENGLKYLEGPPPTPPAPPPAYQDSFGGFAPAKAFISLSELQWNGSGDVSARSSGSGRYHLPAVIRMQTGVIQSGSTMPSPAVMAVLLSIPINRTTLTNIPANRILEPEPGAQQVAPNLSVILDGWANPIIFVPAGGMVVNINDPATGKTMPFLVRSSGTTLFAGAAPPTTGRDRPFFASAGADGDFTSGADNVYSFH